MAAIPCLVNEGIIAEDQSGLDYGWKRALLWMQHLTIVLRVVQALYQRSLDFVKAESYDFLNVEVREFTFNRCPFQ